MPETVSSKLTAKRPWMFRSQWRLFASLFLLLALPTVILTALTANFISNEMSDQAVEQNSVTARLVSKYLEEEFFGLRRYVQSYVTRRRVVDSLLRNDRAALREQIAEVVEQNSKISRAVLTDPRGVLLLDFPYDDLAAGKDFSDRDWYKAAAKKEVPYVSGVYERAAPGQAVVLMIAARIQDNEGNVLGYLGVQYAVKDLMQWLGSVRMSNSERIALFDQHGNQVLRVNAKEDFNISDHPEIRKLLQTPTGTRVVENLDGFGRCILSHVRVPDIGWTVMAYQEEGIIYAPVKRLLGTITFFFLIALSALGVLGWLWQRTLYRYAEDLRRSNKELEMFCYTIAHDLRAPLRAMQGFASILVEDYGEKLDENGKEYARRVSAAAQQMDRLTGDLLNYGRVAHTNLEFVQVDLESALEEAMTKVSAQLEERGAQVSIQKPLGKVSADRAVLVEVFQQLLSNAMKYVMQDVKPEIRIWSELHGRTIKVWVKDNGIGIAPDYHERIFGIFERLHQKADYSGTGVGLAIVKKGLERLGGNVGVESKPGQGSAFWVEVPSS